jgi:palmitoyltransferase
MVLVTFLMASCKDPGNLRPDPNQDFITLLREINPADLCPECKVIRSARSRHCAICNRCVERFDHHCPWINNCVGIKNHNAFMLFLWSIWTKILFNIGAVSYSLLNFYLNFDDAPHIDESDFCFYGLCKV